MFSQPKNGAHFDARPTSLRQRQKSEPRAFRLRGYELYVLKVTHKLRFQNQLAKQHSACR